MNQLIVAAGCFWGVQYYLDQIPGVTQTIAGYTGGKTKNPTYEDVCYANTGHAEVVKVTFDPEHLSLETLVRHFFRLHDPTQLNRQGPDVGDQYRSAVYYADDAQKAAIDAVKQEIEDREGITVVTQIEPVQEFYVAEDYHQKFTEKTGRGACHIPYQAV